MNQSLNQLISKENSTALKGLSAFFIIIAHTCAWTSDIFDATVIGRAAAAVLLQLGGIGVMIFFFLSGYGIHEGYGYRDVGKDYFLKRFRNVWIPYIVVKVFFLLVELFMGITEINSIPRRLWGIVSLEDWFILVITLEYVFYFFARKLSGSYSLLSLIGMNIALCVIFIIQGRADRYINSMWLFVFGIIVSTYKDRILEFMSSRMLWVVIISFGIFVFTGVAFAVNKGNLYADIIKPVSGMALCVFIVCMLQMSDWARKCINIRILKWGGERSLYLYIVHIWTWGVLQKTIDNQYLLTVMFVVVTVGIVELFYRISKQTFGRFRVRHN